MKKIYLTLSILALSLFASAQVVFQSDFENGTGSSEGWMGTKSYTPSIATSYSTTAYHGTLSAQCTNTSTTSHRRYTTQPLSITNGTTYKVNFYAQGNGKIRTAIYKGGNSYGTYNSYITVATSSWTAYSQTVVSDTTSSTAEFIFSVLATTVPNHLLIDSVTITATGTVAPTPFISIQAIQTTTLSNGDSPLLNQTIKTGGLVTAIVTNTAGTATGFYIESATGGPYSGVYAYSTTYAPQVVLGDSVNFQAKVTEFYSMTELTTLASFNKVSSGNTLPTPISVSPISNPGVEQEQYESVLVSISNVTCTVLPNTYGDWKVKDASTYAITIGGDLYPYTPVVGNLYNVTGVMSASTPTTGTITYWTLSPRMASDISASTVGVNELSNNHSLQLYPNPSTGLVNIKFDNIESVKSVEVLDVMGRVLVSIKESDVQQIDLSALSKGLYFMQILTDKGNYSSRLLIEK